MPPALLLVAAALAALVWFGVRHTAQEPTAISPEDPLWRAAIARARATVVTMRQLHDEGRVVWVKFPLGDAAAEREHVWGLLLALEADSLRCTLETPPASVPAPQPSELVVPLRELEDWQVLLDDGAIRGGFTTYAQVQIADRDGKPVPRHVREMVTRMTDPLD